MPTKKTIKAATEAGSHKDGQKEGRKNGSSQGNGARREQPSDAIEVLKAQHRTISETLGKLADFEPDATRLKCLRDACGRWLRHAELEARVAFPVFRDEGVDEAAIARAEFEGDLVCLMMADLAARSSADKLLKPGCEVLVGLMARLIELEESEPDGVFAKAKEAGVDFDALGKKLQAAIAEGEADPAPRIPSSRHLHVGEAQSRGKEQPAMRGNERERDERGRFVEDDDRSRDRSQGSRGGYGRSRSDDDSDRRGWYGDSRGHAEASRRGWDERRSRDDDDDRDRRYADRSGGRDDDDRRSSRSTRSGYDDDRGSREGGRSQSGWYGDSERHSEASRRGWDNPDHGRSGWFGDSDRHSEASRRGWDNSDHGRSGWYGDPEGHSQASRRGWDERRSSSRNDDDDDYDRRRNSRRR